MSAHDEAVEAAASAFSETRLGSGVPMFRDCMKVAITAYLRHMRAAGYVVTRVPGELLPLPDHASDEDRYTRYIWNSARAEMLANAIDGDAP